MVVVMFFCIHCDAGIVMVVSVTASIRVVVEISTNLFSCMFCGCVFDFVVVVVVLTLVGL